MAIFETHSISIFYSSLGRAGHVLYRWRMVMITSEIHDDNDILVSSSINFYFFISLFHELFSIPFTLQ